MERVSGTSILSLARDPQSAPRDKMPVSHLPSMLKVTDGVLSKEPSRDDQSRVAMLRRRVAVLKDIKAGATGTDASSAALFRISTKEIAVREKDLLLRETVRGKLNAVGSHAQLPGAAMEELVLEIENMPPQISDTERKDPFRFADVLSDMKSLQRRLDDLDAVLATDDNAVKFTGFVDRDQQHVNRALEADTVFTACLQRSRDCYRALRDEADGQFRQARDLLKQTDLVLGNAQQNAQRMQELTLQDGNGAQSLPQVRFAATAVAADNQLGQARQESARSHDEAIGLVAHSLDNALGWIDLMQDAWPDDQPLGPRRRILDSAATFMESLPQTESIAGMRNMFAGLADDVLSVMNRQGVLKQSVGALRKVLAEQLDALAPRMIDSGAIDVNHVRDSAQLLREIGDALLPALNGCLDAIDRTEKALRRLNPEKLAEVSQMFNDWLAQLEIDMQAPDNTEALLEEDARDASPFFRPPTAQAVQNQEFLHLVDNAATMDRSTVEDMLIHSTIANAFYQDEVAASMLEAERLVDGDPDLAVPSWQPVADKATLRQLLNLDAFHVLDDGRLIHADTDQVVQIWRNDQSKQIVVGFGGSSAGDAKGGILTRSWHNLTSTVEHWMQNLAHPLESNLLGGPIPQSYPAAAEIVGAVKQWIRETPTLKDYALSVAGHSKGANETCYAALQNELPGFCFCTPAFGKTLFDSVPADKKANAPHLIRHFWIEGDVAPDMAANIAKVLKLTGIEKTVHHAGTAYHLPKGPVPLLAGIGPHEHFHQAVMEFGRGQLRLLDEQEEAGE
jgi:hypothetical protein